MKSPLFKKSSLKFTAIIPFFCLCLLLFSDKAQSETDPPLVQVQESDTPDNPPVEPVGGLGLGEGLGWMETTGWRFRRVNLDGSVSSAQKGQAKGEGDEDSEETYVDSFTRHFRYDTSDVYIPMVGGKLALSMKRSNSGEILNSTDKYPATEYAPITKPFGLGWNSGIGAHLRFENETSDKSVEGVKTNPNFIYVVDENGATYRFAQIYYQSKPLIQKPDGSYGEDPDGIVDERVSYLPLPSNRTDQDVFLTRLDKTLVFTRKFGTKLTFSTDVSIEKEHYLADGIQKKIIKYHRLDSVEDRLGNSLNYSFGTHALIPTEIKATSGTGITRTMRISQSDGQITSVTDPKGNIWKYGYTDVNLDGQALRVLTTVTKPNGDMVRYGYETPAPIEDTRPRDPESTDRVPRYSHLNLNSITSNIRKNNTIPGPNGTSIPWGSDKHTTTSITYEADITTLAHAPSFADGPSQGYYNPYPTRPRVVSSTSLPEGVGASFSSLHTPTAIPTPEGPIALGFKPGDGEDSSSTEPGDATGAPEIAVTGKRGVSVTDAEGHIREILYTQPILFDNKEIENLLTSPSPSLESAGTDSKEEKNPIYLITWQHCKLTHPLVVASSGEPSETVSEEVLFDVNAGLADKEVVDYSGNITEYEYDDSYNIGMLIPVLEFLNGNPIFSPRYRDPTSETKAVDTPDEITTHYKYYSSGGDASKHLNGASRVMTEIIDAKGRVTRYDVQSVTGLRTSEKVYANLADADADQNIVKESYFTYGNTTFPGFLTQTTVKNATHNNGVFSDLVTSSAPDQYGNNATSTIDPNGLAISSSSSFDLNGNTISSTDARGAVTTLSYDSLNRITSATLPDAGQGVATNHTFYDANSRVIATQDALGNISFNYRDKLNRRIKARRVMSDPSTASYGTDGVEDIISHIEYNKLSYPVKSTDPKGFITTMEYDSLMRVVKTTIDPAGLNYVTTVEYGENSGGTAFNTSSFAPTKATDARGYVSIVEYDNLYRPVVTRKQYQLDGIDQLALFARSEVSYDKVGNTVESRAFREEGTVAQISQTIYDALNRPISATVALGTPLASTSTTSYTSISAYKTTDPLGRCTETDYDTAGRAVAVWSPDPLTGLINRTGTATTGSPVIRSEYDANSNVIATINPLGRRFETTYDARNRAISATQPAVADATDPNAPVTSQPASTTTYDQVNKVVSATDVRNITSTSFYDRAYRVITSKTAVGTPDEITTHTSYDKNNNVITVTDANGNITFNTYDVLNRLLTTSTDPTTGNPAAGGADVITTTNLYDQANNLLTVTDGKGQVTGFSYDGLNRKLETIWDPGTAVERIETTEYDALLATNQIDPKGQRIESQYDALFRATHSVYPSRPADDRINNYDLIGNLLSVTYPNESSENQTIRGCATSYDKLNRQITETSNGVTHSTTYDSAGNTLTQTYGSTNRVLTCQYDLLNRLSTCSEATAGQTPRATHYHYDLAGNITRKTLPNGTHTDHVYDNLSRRTSITNLRPDSSIIQSSTMKFDALANVTEIVESSASTEVANGTMTTVNSYDKSYRLLVETRTDTGKTTPEVKATTYSYDKGNNRASKSIQTNGATAQLTTYSYGDGSNNFNSNQLISYNRPDTAETVSFSYDDNGNRETRIVTQSDGITSKTDTYSYDVNNRLVSLDHQTATEATNIGIYHYQYDHRTRRVNRNETGATANTDAKNTRVVFSGGTSVQEHDQLTTGNWQLSTPSVEYIRGSDYGGGVGGVLYTLRNGAASFNYYNSRGDVLAKTDTNGATTWQANYEAFGTRTAENGSSEDRQKANTKDEDPTGLLNEYFRYRDLEAGTFITRDPAGFVDGPNVYTYVRQNPWSAFDPWGLDDEEFDWDKTDHHKVPTSVVDDAGWDNEAKEVFDKQSSKIKTSKGHNNTRHGRKHGYNAEVAAEMAEFLDEKAPDGIGTKSAKEQRKLAEEFVDRIDNTDNKFIKGFNENVHKGPDGIKNWFNKDGKNIVLKATGEVPGKKGAKIINGIAKTASVGGKIFKGVPVVAGVLTGAASIANGKSVSDVSLDVVMSTVGADLVEAGVDRVLKGVKKKLNHKKNQMDELERRIEEMR